MSRRLTHLSIALVLLLSSEVWAIGLGDIQLDSALNEPLRAEISLLSATPEELDNLTIALASAEIFDRYGIDRPFFLQDIQFNIVSDAGRSIVQLRSRTPISEPFLTFLVEATWPSGRLLREYTVLLDPPTFAPPGAQQAPAVTAPARSAPADSGSIERAQPARPSSPPVQSRPAQRPSQAAPVDNSPYNTSGGGDYVVQRGDSLWSIASRMRPDGRLTMNQTMLAIYEANPGAFGGNINVMSAGASLRIPSADQIFQISRGNAFSEVKRQNQAWSGGSDFAPPPPAEETRPSLTLVPPDEEPAGLAYGEDVDTAEPLTRENELADRIDELEAADVPDQPSLIEIRDNELATLRQELAEIRGEVYEPPADVDDPFVDDVVDDTMLEEPDIDEVFSDEGDVGADSDIVGEDVADGAGAAGEDTIDTDATSTVVRTESSKPGIVDQILDLLKQWWVVIAGALVAVTGLLFWFMRRGGDDGDSAGPWESLDSDELSPSDLSSTETLRAPTPDEAIVVVEQDSAIRRPTDETAEMPAAEVAHDPAAGTQEFASIEDTFSSDTAVNLDQTDPVAEADFHMAYGLYDQAADLVNGALETDPEDKGLMSKLCEIYFVWGNRDAFIDAASNLKSAVGGGESSEWDKIVIMGQQIAADHELFAGAGVGAATKAVDLSFEADGGDAGALDMDFGGDTGESAAAGDDSSVDFLFEDAATDDTAESPTISTTGTEKTMAMPSPEDTAESPTIEEQFAGGLEGTSELPSLDESLGQAISDAGQDSEATAEINLDDLDLDIDGLAETELSSLGDLDETGTNEALADDFADTGAVTGKNPQIDTNSTGVNERLELDALIDPDATGEMRLAPDETGRVPSLDIADDATAETEVSIDQGLLDATGMTQVLDEDMTVETISGVDDLLSDDQETLLASLDDDSEDFDFAQTEALPADAFTPGGDLDATGELPVAGTDVDLELSDLTAALKVGGGDTVDQLRDDSTVEQPAMSASGKTAEVPTMSLGPEEMSDDLAEARTMTEVGTKLDLARAYVDMGDPSGARSILEEVLDEGDDGQRQQAQQLLDSLPS